jgi:hypothetical protein
LYDELSALVMARHSDETVFQVDASYDTRLNVPHRLDMLKTVAKHYERARRRLYGDANASANADAAKGLRITDIARTMTTKMDLSSDPTTDAAGKAKEGYKLRVFFTESNELGAHTALKVRMHCARAIQDIIACCVSAHTTTLTLLYTLISSPKKLHPLISSLPPIRHSAIQAAPDADAAASGGAATRRRANTRDSYSKGGKGSMSSSPQMHKQSVLNALGSKSTGRRPSCIQGNGIGAQQRKQSVAQSKAFAHRSSNLSNNGDGGVKDAKKGQNDGKGGNGGEESEETRADMCMHGFRATGVVLEGWLATKRHKSVMNLMNDVTHHARGIAGGQLGGGKNPSKWARHFFSLNTRQLLMYEPRMKGNYCVIGSTCVVVQPDQSRSVPPPSSFDDVKETTKPMRYMLHVRPNSRKMPFTLACASAFEMYRWKCAFDEWRFVSSSTAMNVHLEGWLFLQRDGSDAWKRTYVVVLDDRCWYFEMNPRTAVDLSKGAGAFAVKKQAATEVERNLSGLTSHTGFAYRFNVDDGDDLHHFAADDPDALRLWIDAIELNARTHTLGGLEKVEALDAGLVDSVTQNAPEGEVTFVFTDVQSSTSLWENVPDEMDISLELHDRLMRELLKKYDGYEVKTEGDAFMVTFFNAMDAVMWCLAVQEALVSQDWPEKFLEHKSGAVLVLNDDSAGDIEGGGDDDDDDDDDADDETTTSGPVKLKKNEVLVYNGIRGRWCERSLSRSFVFSALCARKSHNRSICNFPHCSVNNNNNNLTPICNFTRYSTHGHPHGLSELPTQPRYRAHGLLRTDCEQERACQRHGTRRTGDDHAGGARYSAQRARTRRPVSLAAVVHCFTSFFFFMRSSNAQCARTR